MGNAVESIWPAMASPLWQHLLDPDKICNSLCTHENIKSSDSPVPCEECITAMNKLGDIITSEIVLKETKQFLQTEFCPGQTAMDMVDCITWLENMLETSLIVLVQSGR